eukprot:4023525-Ditylum_brightwellii.AAC.1
MKVTKDNTKEADFCSVMASAKRDIESRKHRQYKLDPKKYIHETRDGIDVISIVIDDEESSDEESSGCESSSASPPSFGSPSSGSPSSSMQSDVSTASSSLH